VSVTAISFLRRLRAWRRQEAQLRRDIAQLGQPLRHGPRDWLLVDRKLKTLTISSPELSTEIAAAPGDQVRFKVTPSAGHKEQSFDYEIKKSTGSRPGSVVERDTNVQTLEKTIEVDSTGGSYSLGVSLREGSQSIRVEARLYRLSSTQSRA